MTPEIVIDTGEIARQWGPAGALLLMAIVGMSWLARTFIGTLRELLAACHGQMESQAKVLAEHTVQAAVAAQASQIEHRRIIDILDDLSAELLGRRQHRRP